MLLQRRLSVGYPFTSIPVINVWFWRYEIGISSYGPCLRHAEDLPRHSVGKRCKIVLSELKMDRLYCIHLQLGYQRPWPVD